MGKNNNNQKPIAERKKLSGAQKRKNKKLESEKLIKASKVALKFFKAPTSQGEPRQGDPEACSREGSSDATNAIANSVHQHEDTSEDVLNSKDSDSLQQSKKFDASDPSTWSFPLSPQEKDFILKDGPQQKNLSRFPKDGKFSFNKANYHHPEDGSSRKWLLFSESTNSLFCYSCCLFQVSARGTSSWINYGNNQKGFNDFMHQSRGIKTHEKSELHFQSTIKWKQYTLLLKTGKSLDSTMEHEMRKEISFWKQVLEGLLDAVMFLAKNNLAFQGTNQKIGETQSGNFVSLVELLSKYHPPLAVHLSRIQKGATRVHYISPKIQNEVIEIAANHVKQHILATIKERTYSAMMYDATPDVSHMEQISQVIRTVAVSPQGCKIEEHFLGFLHMDLKTGEDIANAIFKTLNDYGLDVKNCRGQVYDNGANMAGKYKGVQARVKERNEYAVFIPCAAHSLNLVGQNAAAKVLPGKLLLGQIQNVYNFFAASPSRWNKLKNHVKITLKCQSTTRWSSKSDAVSAVTTQFIKIVEALEDIIECDETNAQTYSEANALLSQILTFKFVLGASIWNLFLEKINVCSKLLQNKDLSVDGATKHLAGLLDWLEDFKSYGFERAYEVASETAKNMDLDLNSGFDARTTRGRKPFRFREANDSDTSSKTPIEKFKEEFFDAVHTQIASEFSSRFEELQTSNNMFKFMWGEGLAFDSRDKVIASGKKLAMFYKDDINVNDYLKELEYLKFAVQPFLDDNLLKDTTAMDVLNVLYKNDLHQQFQNVAKALRIFLTLPVSVASNERSFSKLKIIKNYLRSSMGQQRLENLAILSIEHEIAKNISFDTIINSFAEKKCRKVSI